MYTHFALQAYGTYTVILVSEHVHNGKKQNQNKKQINK